MRIALIAVGIVVIVIAFLIVMQELMSARSVRRGLCLRWALMSWERTH